MPAFEISAGIFKHKRQDMLYTWRSVIIIIIMIIKKGIQFVF